MSKDRFNTINKVNEVTLEYEEALRVVQKLNNEFKTLMEQNEAKIRKEQKFYRSAGKKI